MKKVLITGGTGLVGGRLIEKFDQCIVTTRNAKTARQKLPGDVDLIEWPSFNKPLDLSQAGKIDAVVNLMGESLASGRWNHQKKMRIRDSRVIATNRLVEAIGNLDTKPECIISASAVGYYGDEDAREITEECEPGSGFLPDVCQQWEAAANALSDLSIRVVNLRIGVVMARNGGALAEMLPIFKKGIGGRLGNGNQYFPWIHIDDLVRLIHWAVHHPISGPVNGTAPNPVTNREFTKTLSATINRPALFPVPKFALKLALGEFAESLFVSQRVVPAAALAAGFNFQYADLQSALENILK